MRLIDADELKEGLRGNFKDVMGNFVFNTTFSQLEAIIDTTPTVSIDNKGYDQGFKDGKECTLVSIDAIEDITDRMISIISEMDWEKLLKIDNTPTVEQFDDTELQRAVGYSDGYLKGKEERPQGEWKFDGWGTYCSECGYRPKLGGGKFCSECGADMRGGKV